jgi:hypothetical protein
VIRQKLDDREQMERGAVIATDNVATAGDAVAAVRAYQQEHGYVLRPKAPEQLTEAELHRAWGVQMLKGMGLEPRSS